MSSYRRPNQALRGLLGEAGMSAAELAAQVNAIAAENGLVLGYDRSTVAHWLSGTRPRGDATALVVEALSRKLRRSVTLTDAGFLPAPGGGEDTAHGSAASSHEDRDEDAARSLGQLATWPTGHTASRGRAERGAPFRLAALRLPPYEQIATSPFPTGEPPEGARVQASEVQGIEAMARVFHHVDITFGGGQGRRALVAYLASDVRPRLHRPAAPAVRRRLLTATGELAYLCGFMHFDDDLQGLAQRYYLVALRLAAENGSRPDHAVALRALSVQADALGHRREAVRLAESAAAHVAGPHLRRAFVYGQLAVAHAGEGTRHEALRALAHAETMIERAGSAQDTPVGAYHHASLLHQQGVVRLRLGDERGAAAALAASVRHRPADERRARALLLADLARLHLRARRLTEALEVWHRFLDDRSALSSGRVDRAFADMRGLLRPYSRHPSARALLDRAARTSRVREPFRPPAGR
ncbi:hypothetical protein [Streptomyces griseus]|uniref:hypothetical protein n=1 Tax=Streptomyces griseus TaxID=1911 RepID=UPI0005606EBC|nr:hypothetical protein [Streptomyces griseus]